MVVKHKLVAVATLVLIALSAGVLMAQEKADTNLGTASSKSKMAAQNYQEWGYSTDPNEFIDCIAYFAIGNTRFTKAPTFSSSWSGDHIGWSTSISADRKAVYLFGPRTHFGPNSNQSYGISYVIYYDSQAFSQDTAVFDGSIVKFKWARTGTTGDGGPGSWNFNSNTFGGPYSPIPTNWVSMAFSGTVNSPGPGAFVGESMQVGPMSAVGALNQPSWSWGILSSYSASSPLPQLTGGDINMYGWGMNGTIDYLDIASRTHVSSGKWWIYYKPITNFPLEEGTYTIKTSWPDGWGQPAKVTGKFWAQSGSTVQPPWPTSYVDWSPTGVGNFTGSFSNPSELSGTFSSSDNKLVLKAPTGQEIIFARFNQIIDLELHQEHMATPAAGYQAFMSFDNSMLSLMSGQYTSSPYQLGLLSIGALNGNLNLAAGIEPSYQPIYAGNIKLADLRFKSGNTEGITQVVFRENNPMSQFTDDGGYSLLTQTVDGPIIVVDNTPPTGFTLSVNPAGWTNAGQIVYTFSATDALSGIDHYDLRIAVADYLKVTSPYSLNISALGTGTYQVAVTAFDKAGNSSVARTTVQIDRTPAVLSTAPTTGATVVQASQTITGTVSDADSGVATLTCKLNNGVVTPVTLNGSNFSVDLVLVPGVNTVDFTLTDKVGNITTKTLNYTYNQPAPAISVLPSLAPNASGSASYNPWLTNRDYAVLNGFTEHGDSYEEFKALNGTQDYSSLIVTSFNSWKGLVENSDSQLGTQVSFVYVLDNGVRSNIGAKKLDLGKVAITGTRQFAGTDNTADNLTEVWSTFTWNDVDRQSTQFLSGPGNLKGYNWNGTGWVEVTEGRQADLIICSSIAEYAPDAGWGTGQPAIDMLYKRLTGALPWSDSNIRRKITNIKLNAAYLSGDGIPAAESGYKQVNFETTDATDPVVAITSPLDGLKTNISSLKVSGTASDSSTLDSGIKSVTLTLNGGLPVSVTTSDYFANWTADLTLSLQGENVIVVTATDFAGRSSSKTIHFIYDSVAPILTIPQDQTVLALPNSISAVVNTGIATAMDNCDPSPVISSVRSDGKVLSTPYTGTTTIIWTARDATGNESQGTQTIIVRPYNSVTLTIELEGVKSTPKRMIDLTFGGNSASGTQYTVSSEVTFDSNGIGIVTIDTLPAGYAWTSVSAKDKQHTLRSKVALVISADGSRYVASFTGDDKLLGGDLTNDNLIDIRDFGIFAGQFGKPLDLNAARNADITCNGIVDALDFSYFTAVGHFLAAGDAAVGSAVAAGAKSSMTIKEMTLSFGYDAASKADMNHDGVINNTDVQLFVQSLNAKRGR